MKLRYAEHGSVCQGVAHVTCMHSRRIAIRAPTTFGAVDLFLSGGQVAQINAMQLAIHLPSDATLNARQSSR